MHNADYKILCVEDEAEYRESIVEFLAGEGFQVLQAETGVKGLEKIIYKTPDLVLSDINMPSMTGFELLRELRINHPGKAHTPFIFLTAFGEKDDIIKGRRLGCDDYLIKPVDLEVLLTLIETRIRQVESRKKLIDSKLDGFRQRMLHMMSHELRAPLNTIIGFSEFLDADFAEKAEFEKYKEYVTRINKASYTQLAVVNNTIDTIMLASEETKPLEQEVEFAPLLLEAIGAAANVADFSLERITREITPDIRGIKGDYNMLVRALEHLIADMVRYSKKEVKNLLRVSVEQDGGVLLTLLDAPLLDSSNAAPHRLEDEMHDNILNAILQYRGVNLYFAREIMQLHNGTIHLLADKEEKLAVLLHFPVERVLT